MVLLHTSDSSGTVFVRTDQLDGETDWKVRESVKCTQKLGSSGVGAITSGKWSLMIEAPSDEIYSFQGLFIQGNDFGSLDNQGLKITNTIWANMVVASGEAVGVVSYVGKETRIQLNNQARKSKFGQTDEDINTMTKYLFFLLSLVSFILLLLSGKILHMEGLIFYCRVFIIMSCIIPISMKVNIDFAKLYYSLVINNDKDIAGAIARNSNIPEELGRIHYLLSDKTGTLTQNCMELKGIHSQIKNFDQDELFALKKKILKFRYFKFCVLRKWDF